jgi:hypothetical protein
MAAKPLLTSTFVVSYCPLLSPRFCRVAAPARPTQAVSGPTIGLRSVLESLSNVCSITWFGGDLARPGPGVADRGAAGAVRGAAWRRPGHHPRGGRQRRAVPPCRRHQDLEPDAAGTPAPARGLRPTPRRLPRPPTNQIRRRIGTACSDGHCLGEAWAALAAHPQNNQQAMPWGRADRYADPNDDTAVGNRVSKSKTTTCSGRTAMRPILMAGGNDPT